MPAPHAYRAIPASEAMGGQCKSAHMAEAWIENADAVMAVVSIKQKDEN